MIREEIKKLREGADWIILRSAGKDMAVNSFTGDFLNIKDFSIEYEVNSNEWAKIFKKLNKRDKDTVTSIVTQKRA